MAMTDKHLRIAINRAGGVPAVAEYFGIAPQAVWQWTRCPVLRVIDLERLSGISRHDLRPDVYPREPKLQTA